MRKKVTKAEFDSLKHAAAGEEVAFSGFTSTSQVPLQGFADAGSISYEVFVPKGSRGVLSGFGESEVESLFNHGAKFKVLSEKELVYTIAKKDVVKKVYQLEYIGGP